MKNSPGQKEMMSAANPQGGKPLYVDEISETPMNEAYPKRGQDAPAYIASNPRYSEYR